MLKFITEHVSSKFAVGLVGGSDEAKICEQMGGKHGELNWSCSLSDGNGLDDSHFKSGLYEYGRYQ